MLLSLLLKMWSRTSGFILAFLLAYLQLLFLTVKNLTSNVLCRYFYFYQNSAYFYFYQNSLILFLTVFHLHWSRSAYVAVCTSSLLLPTTAYYFIMCIPLSY